MHYDPVRNAYIDDETQEVVYQEDIEAPRPPAPTPTITKAASSKSNKRANDFERMFELARIEVQESKVGDLENELYALHHDQAPGETFAAPPEGNPEYADWTFARTLQALEFEIPNEAMEESDFSRKEYRASRSCTRQLLTVSFFICIVQIALLVAMIQTDGYDPSNPVMGPPVTTMVRWGAKETGLIVIKNEWWRLLSAVMLHAGILHILSNVAIQVRVGGYLNLVYGTWKWLWIYFSSGIFGAMMSCLFLPSSVGVGSSGALMGMLSSWVVWIIFRWQKIPDECKKQRNCQLMVVAGSIVLTLATSAMPNVDWAAHLGGAIQGTLWGFILLSNELDNTGNRNKLRVIAMLLSLGLFGFSLYYMICVLQPSTSLFSLWADNDDWGR